MQGTLLLIHGIATAFGMEKATASLIPESINEKAQDGDDESLTPDEARIFKTCVGKAMYISHHRPDIQHSVNTLSRSMRNPTTIAMRRLKKLTRYLLGTSEVYQELGLDPHAGLATKKMVKAAVDEQFSFTDAQCSHGHAHRRRELFRAQRPSCTAVAQEQRKVWEQQCLKEWLYKTVPLLLTDPQTALAVCKRRGLSRMKQVDGSGCNRDDFVSTKCRLTTTTRTL